MPHFARAHALLLALAATAAAQSPPGASMPQDLALETSVADAGAARVRWQAGRDALARGDTAAARQHLTAALEFHPAAPSLLLDLALAWRDDPALAPLWAERFVRAASDARGRLELDATLRKQCASAAGFDATLKAPQELAAARAAAIAELAKFVDKHKPAGKPNGARAVLVRWAAETLLELGVGAPGALAAAAPGVARVQAAFEPDFELVLAGLARVLARRHAKAAGDAPTTGPDPAPAIERQRVRAARIVLGLERQGTYQDLQGPRARSVGKLGDDARAVLADHAAAALAPARVWTIAELAALTPPEAEAFTQAHRDWRAPGIATSATGRYRIETVCGYHTLLGVARTIELHHARLVDHYGSDPFAQRQGVVRIVPEAHELETEGSPYWWAGGFQAGDRTTVRFAWSRISDLGRTLTHELTHRFDGVLRPFLGAWYGEGHAQWTGAHYGAMQDARFAADWLDRRAPAHTWYKGYGDRTQFELLLNGKVEDYRDNYFAGYSLYAFLRSFPPEAPRYRGVLEQFERNARAGTKDPLAYFAATFCDGKQGRPGSLDELFEQWQVFLRGCYDAAADETKAPAWLARYSASRGGVDRDSNVMDEPTWSWARDRAEPFFGQDHAAAATLLLHEVGDHEATIAAGIWSLTTDGWRPETAAALLASLRTARPPEAAEALAVLTGARFAALTGAEAKGLLAALPRTAAFAEALAQRAQSLATVAPAAAAAAAEEHRRLAARFGRALPRPRPAPAALPRQLGGHGYVESSLTGFDDRRTPGLWYATPDGDLHVGRERPRDGTGTLDRTAHQRDAFAHTAAWQAPGAYTLRGSVHFTTSYASGAIVFGHTRRDRGVRLHFSSGDFDYATGRSESNRHGGRVRLELRGLWQRDGAIGAPLTSYTHRVSPEQPSFAFALHVHGPRVVVEIDGEAVMRYAVPDGTPIEGHVGFATGMGAVRVQLPTVQRRDGEPFAATAGLALDRQPDHALEALLLLPVTGVPRHANGTLVLWLPRSPERSPVESLPRVLPVLGKLLATRHEHPQEWVLAVPRELAAAERARAVADLAAVRGEDVPVIEHDVGEPLDGTVPWLLFVDGQGLLAAAAATDEPGLHSTVAKWSRLYRRRAD